MPAGDWVEIVPYRESLAPGRAYAVLEAPGGWHAGHATLSVAKKRPTKPDGGPYPSEEFLRDLAGHLARAAEALRPLGLLGYIVYATKEAELAILGWESERHMREAFLSPQGQAILEEVARIFEPRSMAVETLPGFAGTLTRSFLDRELGRPRRP